MVMSRFSLYNYYTVSYLYISLRKEKLHEKEVRDMKRLHDDREKANSDLVSSLETALNKTTHSQVHTCFIGFYGLHDICVNDIYFPRI